jgi:tetratricopeptide (TPR) repeat protein
MHLGKAHALKLVIGSLALLWAAQARAQKNTKGVLPELKIQAMDSEDINQQRALKTELLVAKTEEKAIASLLTIIKKQRGSSNEPDLWFRLAELYMRRAKTGRFFDLHRDNSQIVKFAPPAIREQTAAQNLKKAITTYQKIEKNFPRFHSMDAVLFNTAFSFHQLKNLSSAQAYYAKVLQKFPKSNLVPDTHLAMGEMHFDQGRFTESLDHFLAIESFPTAKVYSFGVYKSAWSYYNLRQTEKGIQKLLQVAAYYHPDSERARTTKPQYNLRSEALRDLALFFSDTYSPEEAFSFFAKHTLDNELGESLLNLTSLYASHSRPKEVILVLEEFLKKRPLNSARIKTHLRLMGTYEGMKNRKLAVNQLREASLDCAQKSQWRDSHSEAAIEDCDGELAKLNLELAKKWWNLWQKNMTQRDLAEHTQEAFRLLLEREDPKNPQTKNRFAYAELLFQLGKFSEAASNYEQVADAEKQTSSKHDALYGALVAREKSNSSKKNEEILRLCDKYLENFPSGKFANQVRFKLGFIYYEQKNHSAARKWLTPLAQETKNIAREDNFISKAEDLLLDILNQEKDFGALKNLSGQLLGRTKDPTRKELLKKINEESAYAEITEIAKSSEPKLVWRLFKNYTELYPSSPLTKEAHWQALSLAFSSGQAVDGADLARQYHQRYPGEKRAVEALRQAASAYVEAGLLIDGARLLEALAAESGKPSLGLSEKDQKTFIEAAADLYKMEGGTDFLRIQNQILQMGIEPFTSDIQLERLRQLVAQKKWNDSFNLAKTLVGGKGSENTRSEARLIQAEILEKEFIDQSIKSSLERLPLVLSLKTEKLDKAQTAYLSAARMTSNLALQLRALEGLQRLYQDYVTALSVDKIRTELSSTDREALQAELAKLTDPFRTKQKETEEKIADLKKKQSLASRATLDARSQIDRQPATSPQGVIPPAYHPEFSSSREWTLFARLAPLTPICTQKAVTEEGALIKLSQRVSLCLQANQLGIAEQWAQKLSREAPQSFLSPFYWSLIAEQKGQTDKALFLIDKALAKNSDLAFLHLHKARILAKKNDWERAKDSAKKVRSLKLATPDVVEFLNQILDGGEA